MKELRIVLEGEKPVSNNKFYAGMHWAKRKAIADEKHLLVRSQIDAGKALFENPVHILMVVFAGDLRRRDIDNMNVKMYIDGLVPHVIPEDDWRYVKAVTKVYEHDKERPRIELIITEYEE